MVDWKRSIATVPTEIFNFVFHKNRRTKTGSPRERRTPRTSHPRVLSLVAKLNSEQVRFQPDRAVLEGTRAQEKEEKGEREWELGGRRCPREYLLSTFVISTEERTNYDDSLSAGEIASATLRGGGSSRGGAPPFEFLPYSKSSE